MRERLKKLKNRKALIAAVCYGLYAAVWLGVALLRLAGDAGRPEQPLLPAAATPYSLAETDTTGTYLSEGVDPQLVFEGLDAKVRLVRLDAEFAYDPGEMELFYTRPGQPDFSARQRVIGVPQDDGSYLYSLPPGRVSSLRVDPGAAGGNTIAITAVTLNPHPGAGHYLIPSLRDVAAFCLWPALALCVVYTIIEGISFALGARQRQAEKRT